MDTTIEKHFSPRGHRIGSVLLFDRETILEILDYCQEHGIVVFGVEGFHRIGEKIQPSQESSIDLEDNSLDSPHRIREFVKGVSDPSVWFEVMVDEC